MKRKVYLLVIACLCTAFAWSQTRQVTGRVVSDSSTALAGVSVTVKGTTTTVATNNDGRYSINIPNRDNVVLTFSSVGYSAQDVGVGNRSVVNVTLYTQASALNDVVVVGYQTVRRRDLTGSVSSINAKQLKDIPINSAAQALAGRLAGVQVTGAEGSPDAQVTIRVRGGGSITQDNSPLYVVDGIITEDALSTLSPQDIESIDVLKDASSTAIYGARGANGVVIITTKGGHRGRTTISYNGYVGVQKMESELDVLNPYDYVLYQYELAQQRGSQAVDNFTSTFGTWQDLELYKQAPFVDWQDQVFGRPAATQTHNVSISGGNDKTQLNLSLTSNDTKAIMENSGFNRKLVNFRLNHEVSDALKTGVTIRFNNQNVDGAGTSNPGSSGTNYLRQATRFIPYVAKGQPLDYYDADLIEETKANGLYLVNPLLLLNSLYKKQYQTLVGLSGYADLKITPWLSFRTTLGYDYQQKNTNQYDDSLSYNSRANGNGMPLAILSRNNYTTLDNSNVFTLSNSKFNGAFHEDNSIQLIVGQESYERHYRAEGINQRYFPNGTTAEKALGNLSLASPPTGFYQASPTSGEGVNRIMSFFSRVNYNYKDKYLASASLRADGSSPEFAPGNRWGYFPAASFAWRISREDFMESLDRVISDLKLRVEYGEAGNNRIGSFLYETMFSTGEYYGLQNQLRSAYTSRALANAFLKWEAIVTRDIGLDFGLFHNRVQVSADYYRNKSKDLLVNIRVPSTSGYTEQTQNIGSTANNGFELQLNASVINTANFNWNANFNISTNRNKVLSLGGKLQSFTVNSGWAGSNNLDDYIVQVGESVGNMYGFVNDGYYTLDEFDYNAADQTYTLKSGVVNNPLETPQPGTIKFKDLNGDKEITADDRTIIGNAFPKFFGGLNQQFGYRNFDLSVFVNFQYGNDVFNANKLEFASGYTPYANLLTIMNNRWRTIDEQGNVVTDPAELQKLNANATLWQPVRNANAAFAPQSWAVEDGSFVRINNITLGYTLPTRITKKAFVRTFRAYVTLNNLAVFTPYSGYDPEVSTRRSTPMTPGVDFSAYPRSRSFIFGVNVTF